jgi:hypothetical protein
MCDKTSENPQTHNEPDTVPCSMSVPELMELYPKECRQIWLIGRQAEALRREELERRRRREASRCKSITPDDGVWSA